MNLTNKKEALTYLRTALGKGAQTVIDIASEILGNPIVLIDLSYTLLNHTENVETDDPLWNELVTRGKFSHETVDFFNSEKFIEVFAKAERAVLLKSPKLKYDRVSAPIFNFKDEQIGSICVVGCNKPFEDIDYDLAVMITDQLALELCKTKLTNQAYEIEESIITNLIEFGGEKAAESNNTGTSTEKSLKKLYKGLKKNIYIAVIDILQYDKTLTHLVYFRDLFKSIKSEFDYYVYLNNVIAIISTDQPIIGVKHELKQLNDFFTRYEIYAGISDSFSNLRELRGHFKQALHALNFGLEMNYGKNIFMFADFRLEAFIKDNSEQVAKLCHPVVYYIINYDAEHKTNYKDYLDTYLLAGRCCERASKMSKIPLEEFQRVLAEIEDLFELDFTNMNTVFGMFCSMKLQEYFKGELPKPPNKKPN